MSTETVVIKKDTVVSLAYVLKNSSGEELDRATKEDSFLYLHGHGQIVPGLENALVGLEVGNQKNIVIPPADAYGEFVPELKMELNRSQFPENNEIEKGMQFVSQDQDGNEFQFTVVDTVDDKVIVDGNHPLAGETLHFDVEVLEVRNATQEELMHGHAHGPNGHHHH